MERQLREHAGVANELDLSGRDRAHTLVVPYRGAGSDRRPTPPQRVLHWHFKERFGCSLQSRRSGGVSLGGQLSHAVKQQLEGPLGSPDGGGSARTARQISRMTSPCPAMLAAPQAVR